MLIQYPWVNVMNKLSVNTDSTNMDNVESCDVAIIGSGPTGLSAAITLKKAGLNNIVVIEREAEAGGVPRHCGHPPFGFKEYKQILTGSKYAKKNVERALKLGINIQCKTTVTKLGKNGKLSLATTDGLKTLSAKRVHRALLDW